MSIRICQRQPGSVKSPSEAGGASHKEAGKTEDKDSLFYSFMHTESTSLIQIQSALAMGSLERTRDNMRPSRLLFRKSEARVASEAAATSQPESAKVRFNQRQQKNQSESIRTDQNQSPLARGSLKPLRDHLRQSQSVSQSVSQSARVSRSQSESVRIN